MAPAGSTPAPEVVQISPKLQQMIDWFMQNIHQNFIKNVGESVKLICGHSITWSVLMEIPDAELMWTFNEQPLSMDPSRILYLKGNVEITDLTPGDTGVYLCAARWGAQKAQQNVTLGVYSVSVKATSTTRYVYELDRMRLVSHSTALGGLFPSSTRQWFYNGTGLKSIPQTLASNRTDDVVPRVTKGLAGDWECLVVDVNSSRVWNTAWYRISVEDPPSVASRMYRFLADHSTIVLIILTIIVVVGIIVFIFFSFQMKSVEDEADNDFTKYRDGWEQTLNQQMDKEVKTVNPNDLLGLGSEENKGDGEGKKSSDESSGSDSSGGGPGSTTSSGSVSSSSGSSSSSSSSGSSSDGDDDADSDKKNKDESSDVEGELNVGDKKTEVNDRTENASPNNMDTGVFERSRMNEQMKQRKRENWRSVHGRKMAGIEKYQDPGFTTKNKKRGNRQTRFSEEVEVVNKNASRSPKRLKRKQREARKIQTQPKPPPPVSKSSAVKWLTQNSVHFRKLNAQLQDKNKVTSPSYSNIRSQHFIPVHEMPSVQRRIETERAQNINFSCSKVNAFTNNDQSPAVYLCKSASFRMTEYGSEETAREMIPLANRKHYDQPGCSKSTDQTAYRISENDEGRRQSQKRGDNRGPYDQEGRSSFKNQTAHTCSKDLMGGNRSKYKTYRTEYEIQTGRKCSNDETSRTCSKDQTGRNKSTNLSGGIKSRKHQTCSITSKVRSGRITSKDRCDHITRRDQSSRTTSKDQSSRITSKDQSSRITSKDQSGHITSKDQSSRITSKDQSSRITSKDQSGLITTKDQSGRITSKDQSGRTTSKDQSGRITSKDQSSRTTSKDQSGLITTKDQSGRITSKDQSGRTTSKDQSGHITTKDQSGRISSRDQIGRITSKNQSGRSSTKVENRRADSRITNSPTRNDSTEDLSTNQSRSRDTGDSTTSWKSSILQKLRSLGKKPRPSLSSQWLRSDIKYTVLPQFDDTDFMEL